MMNRSFSPFDDVTREGQSKNDQRPSTTANLNTKLIKKLKEGSSLPIDNHYYGKEKQKNQFKTLDEESRVLAVSKLNI